MDTGELYESWIPPSCIKQLALLPTVQHETCPTPDPFRTRTQSSLARPYPNGMQHSFAQSPCALQGRAYANACDDPGTQAGFKNQKTNPSPEDHSMVLHFTIARPDLAPKHLEVLCALCRACEREDTEELRYVSEWLGYLPFGQEHWVEIGKQLDVQRDFPKGWSAQDLNVLKERGYLSCLRHETSSDTDGVTTYQITAAGWARASRAQPDDSEPQAQPRASKILGTLVAATKEQPFVFHVPDGRLQLGFDWPDRTPSVIDPELQSRVVQALRGVATGPIQDVRMGQWHCYDCGQWFDVQREPSCWSYGMCLNCSMDRASDIGD